MNDGTLLVNGSVGVVVGNNGTANFTQNGGTVSATAVAGELNVTPGLSGIGTYTMNGGTLLLPGLT